jgi:hypothetical protein
MDVLLLDDWGLAPPQDQERRDLLEILEDRYGRRSRHEPAPPGPVARSHRGPHAGRRHLRSPPAQRAPNRAKRSLTAKGGQARQLIGRPASLRSDHDPRSVRSRWSDLGVHFRRCAQSKLRADPLGPSAMAGTRAKGKGGESGPATAEDEQKLDAGRRIVVKAHECTLPPHTPERRPRSSTTTERSGSQRASGVFSLGAHGSLR